MTHQKKHVLVAGLFHETHTFLDQPTGMEQFRLRLGDELFECRGDASPLGGVLDYFDEPGWEVLPSVDYRASPSGVVEDEVFESFWEEFSNRWPAEADAVFLVLHGAMVTQSLPDPEGEFLHRLRQLPGARELPVFGVYDLHANFSPEMAGSADALFAYRKNPHSDARESALRAARALDDCLARQTRPSMQYRHTGLIWDPTSTGTDDSPMADLESLARQIESENEFVIGANINAGFAFADTPHVGVSLQLITEDSTPGCCDPMLDQLEARARELHPSSQREYLSLDDALASVSNCPAGKVVLLVEPSDNIGGGAPGDGTGLFREILRAGLDSVAICLNDPESVSSLEDCSPGTSRSLHLGGKGSRFDEGPVELEVEFISRGSGEFDLEDPQSHLASMVGNRADMGPCAVVRHRGITLLLTSRKIAPFDLGQWRSQGIEPTDHRFIVVKAAVAHRRAYDPITAQSFWVDTPGPCRVENARVRP